MVDVKKPEQTRENERLSRVGAGLAVLPAAFAAGFFSAYHEIRNNLVGFLRPLGFFEDASRMYDSELKRLAALPDGGENFAQDLKKLHQAVYEKNTEHLKCLGLDTIGKQWKALHIGHRQSVIIATVTAAGATAGALLYFLDSRIAREFLGQKKGKNKLDEDVASLEKSDPIARGLHIAAIPAGIATGLFAGQHSVRSTLIDYLGKHGFFNKEYGAPDSYQTMELKKLIPPSGGHVDASDTMRLVFDNTYKMNTKRFERLGLGTSLQKWQALHIGQKQDAVIFGLTAATITAGALLFASDRRDLYEALRHRFSLNDKDTTDITVGH